MTEPRLDIIGAALADPSRSRILCELMDGRAFTNKELACAANISPQTATVHLRQLNQAGLTTSLKSGRHIYHRIAGEEVARVLEGLASLSPTDHVTRAARSSKARTGQGGQDVLLARCCYNHIAGRLGVLLLQGLTAKGVVLVSGDSAHAGPAFQDFVQAHGLEVPKPGGAQPIARLCLDWTERRHHLSGPLATALLQWAFDDGWVQRVTGTRALLITSRGYDSLQALFGITQDALRSGATD